MEAPACEIGRLPEELLSAALARTSPRDAAFRAAADSDSVWACFLPHGALPPLADGELPATAPLPPPPCSKKDLFLRSRSPVLLQDKRVSLWLDRETGARCYMLPARDLHIAWGDTPENWSWIPRTDSRFSEGAELMGVDWFEIRGKIPRKMLSRDTIYVAYIVFKVNSWTHGLDSPPHEASISGGETNVTRKVGFLRQIRTLRTYISAVPYGEPEKRADGWMEVELGEFFNARDDEDGEVSFSVMETTDGNFKCGLIVQGIEIRRKSG